jgi:hypothetical protein
MYCILENMPLSPLRRGTRGNEKKGENLKKEWRKRKIKKKILKLKG